MAAEVELRARMREPLLSLEEARERMLTGVQPLPPVSLPLRDALGHVLAAPVDALVTVPPWDNSAMDGFAVRAVDVEGASTEHPVELHVVGEVAAGHAPAVDIQPGTTVRVLTGGMIPPGADAVVPVEDTDAPPGIAALPDRVAVHRAVAAGAHLRSAGSDVAIGERILATGTVLRPAQLAVAAATGHARLTVHPRPRVAVLATGDELLPAGEPLAPARIHDSNSVSIAAQADASGATVLEVGIVEDRLDAVRAALESAAAEADVVVATGGVSVGAHDVVRDAFASLGTLDLWRIAVQPGKPLAFGRAPRASSAEALLFGLPGNPVSSFVTFELFVRPVVRRLAGHADPVGRRTVRATLTEAVTKSPGRRAFLRVRLERDDGGDGWLASLAGGQSSHVLSALAQADGLAIVSEEVDSLPLGAVVEVILLERDGC